MKQRKIIEAYVEEADSYSNDIDEASTKAKKTKGISKARKKFLTNHGKYWTNADWYTTKDGRHIPMNGNVSNASKSKYWKKSNPNSSQFKTQGNTFVRKSKYKE